MCSKIFDIQIRICMLVLKSILAYQSLHVQPHDNQYGPFVRAFFYFSASPSCISKRVASTDSSFSENPSVLALLSLQSIQINYTSFQ